LLKQILISLLVLGLIGGLAGGALFAHFSDVEYSNESTFTAIEWYADLAIDVGGNLYNHNNEAGGPGGIPSAFPLFGDNPGIQPCHGGNQSLSIHIKSTAPTENIAIKVKNIVNNEVSLVEPEAAAGDVPDDPNNNLDGELSGFLWFQFWHDEGSTPGWQNNDDDPSNDDPEEGNGVLDPGEQLIWQGYAYQFVNGQVLPNTPFPVDPSVVSYVGISWHFDQNNGPWSGFCSPWGDGYPAHNPNVDGGGNTGGGNVNTAMTDNYQCVVALSTT
jgi:hypothetical protein